MPLDYKIDARTAMDDFYGVGNWSYRTAPSAGSDLGAALNAAMTTAKAVYPRLEIIIPPTGPWYMATPISPANVTGNHIHGAGGPFGTIIYYDNDASFFDIGYNGDHLEGGLIEDMAVALEDGRPEAGCFIRLYAADNTGAPCGYVFNRLRCSATGASSWVYCMAITGVQRRAPAQGIRGVTVRDSILFCGRSGGIWAVGINQAIFENVGVAVPRTSTGADVLIGGGPDEDQRSSQVIMNGLVTVGAMNINNSTYVVGNVKSSGLTVGGGLRNAALFHAGPVSGTPSAGFVMSI